MPGQLTRIPLAVKQKLIFVLLVFTASVFTVQNLGLLSHKHLLTSVFTTGISCFSATGESPLPKHQ